MAQQDSLLEVVANETFSEEESFTFQSVVFDNESKKLIVERGDQKSKRGKSRLEVDLMCSTTFRLPRLNRSSIKL
jgi:hypothetical protein